ncbi:hypothetical protein KJ567_00045 [Candidatus Bipolaricaulota bacterium]|nr:hypothetical protein [Candidatus Bipolaricaulota bacterium]
MAKYDPLLVYLQSIPGDRVTLGFAEIGRLVGGLPRSADQHRAWWANTRSHLNAVAWLDAGWIVDTVDFRNRRVVFVPGTQRGRASSGSSGQRRPGARSVDVSQRIKEVIGEFATLLEYYDHALPFDRSGQYIFHRRTIDRRFEAGSMSAGLGDEIFLQDLYSTLQAWGIGSRASRLAPFSEFCAELRRWEGSLQKLDGLRIDVPGLDVEATGEALWRLIEGVNVVDNQARIVALSKTLHHLLPDLLPPIDRMYTQTFFGFHSPEFQYGQEQVFTKVWRHFTTIAAEVDPSRYVGEGWRTSRSKVIDNAIVAYVHRHRPADT